MNGIPPTLDAYLFRESEPQTRLDPQTERHRRRTAGLLGLSALVSLSLLVGFGAGQHANRAAATIATLDAARAAVPIVHVTAVKTEDTPIQIDLPGTTQAVHSATLDARATGYIGKRNVDIGSRVHVGDAPAIISAPELDQQLVQAHAQLAQRQPALAQAQAIMWNSPKPIIAALCALCSKAGPRATGRHRPAELCSANAAQDVIRR